MINQNIKGEKLLEEAINEINNMNINEGVDNQNIEELNIENDQEQLTDRNELYQNDKNMIYHNYQLSNNINKYKEDEIVLDNNIINNDINEEMNNNQYFIGDGTEEQNAEYLENDNINNKELEQDIERENENYDDNPDNLTQNYDEINENIKHRMNDNEFDDNIMNINSHEFLDVNNNFLNNHNILNLYNKEKNELDENEIIHNDLLFDRNNTEVKNTNNSININNLLTRDNNKKVLNELNHIGAKPNNNKNLQINNNDKNDLNNIYSLKSYIINLEQKCAKLQKENKSLKVSSQINKRKDPNYEIIENSIKQGTILLDDVKRKNFYLNKKIKILENKNKQLNYQLIETMQKLKRAENDLKNPLLQKINQNINSKNISLNISEIKTNFTKFNNKLDENDIIISKLKFDKKALEMKLEEEKISHENELKLMLNYKNSELSVYQKTLDNIKNQISNNNVTNNDNDSPLNLNSKNYIQKFTEFENKIMTLSNEINNYKLDKKKLENKINSLKNNIIEKDNTINTLNKRIIETEGNFNLKLLEIQQFSDENKEQFEQLVNERDELLKKNQELSNGLLQFDDKVKEANNIFINKTEFYNQSLYLYKNKINDYKKKINILKKKINELYLFIEKLKLNDYNVQKNSNIKSAYNTKYFIQGTFHRSRGARTPFIGRHFRAKDDISLYNFNKRNNISIFDENDINNSSQIGAEVIQGNFNEKKLDNGKGEYNSGEKDDKLEYAQRKYLENYKSFLSSLDY